jgi:ketosteroid isomerase-like protein
MKGPALLFACVALAASTPRVAAACAPTPEAALDKFLLAFNALDWPTFASCLADDVTLFNPDIPGATSLHRLDGRAAVERSFRGVFDAASASTPPQGPNIRPAHLTLRRDGNFAVATFEFPRGESAFGRRTVLLVRRGGGWRIAHIHASNVSGAR